MATSKTVGQQNRVDGTFETVESLTQSTATAAQSIGLTSMYSTLGMGTATGRTVNRYLLAAGTQGQHKWLGSTATGEAKVDVAGGTATGSFVYTVDDQWDLLVYVIDGWKRVNGSTTIATATNE